jgi:hypothetical protein
MSQQQDPNRAFLPLELREKIFSEVVKGQNKPKTDRGPKSSSQAKKNIPRPGSKSQGHRVSRLKGHRHLAGDAGIGAMQPT